MILAIAAGVLCATGTYLAMSRHLSRVILGLGLLGHGVNLMLLLSGRGGAPAFIDPTDPAPDAGAMSDPLPQAFILTAIVISFGVLAFMLVLAYRSWSSTGDDTVEQPGDTP